MDFRVVDPTRFPQPLYDREAAEIAPNAISATTNYNVLVYSGYNVGISGTYRHEITCSSILSRFYR
ncbi:hypothetical protein L917_21160 [Phytophthora nicotianae]|uniref:Uncharacterized protein n=1 Tax=Phytophthora nicotianae TaxID=4792 RepID=W2M6T4_PHYNI|nr:hypothetical protein L917_21160 [Phytophthora nicotianae]ETM31224.1 hypothetical protein L914_21174 [Phytophthora nicotianae]